MGKRGFPPDPTALKLAKGTAHNVRKDIQAKEPKPPEGTPHCPAWLTTEGTEIWRQVTRQLNEVPGLLTKVDGKALARYCDMYYRWLEAQAFIEKNGNTYAIREKVKKEDEGKVDEDGNPVLGRAKYIQQFPEVAIYHKLGLALLRLEEAFGMTPAARTRIQLDVQAKPRDDFQDFLDDKPEAETSNG